MEQNNIEKQYSNEKGRLDKLGLHAAELTPAQLAALVKADYARWIPAIKASGLSLQ